LISLWYGSMPARAGSRPTITSTTVGSPVNFASDGDSNRPITANRERISAEHMSADVIGCGEPASIFPVRLKSCSATRHRTRSCSQHSPHRGRSPSKPPNPRLISARIEGPPPGAKIRFEPGAGIHWRDERDANVALDSLWHTVQKCAWPGKVQWPNVDNYGKLVTEFDVLMDPVADGLYSWPSR
jgi:hypothetical protein